MRAIVVNAFGGPSVLELAELPDPAPAPLDVVVSVRSAAVNRRDRGLREGLITPRDRGKAEGPSARFPMVLGSDGAGVVVAVGAGVPVERIGAEVVINPSLFWGDGEMPGPDWEPLGVPRQGTYAQLIAVPAGQVRPRPDRLSWHEAAALPLAGLTAWRAVVTRAQVCPGERVLVPGAGAGVSTFVIQLAAALGADVVVTSSSQAKLDRSLELGAVGGALYTDDDWTAQVGEVDVIIDSAGTPTWTAAEACLRTGGRLVSLGRTAGGVAQVNIGTFFHKQWSFLGTANGSPREFDALLAHVRTATWQPVVDSVYRLEGAADAHARLDSPEHYGKIVLDIG